MNACQHDHAVDSDGEKTSEVALERAQERSDGVLLDLPRP
jgi:hypothetical protein